VKFAYADPPYLGCGRLYAEHHPDARIWDAPATHRLLIERLMEVNPDGWALSLNVPSLKTILSYCPEDIRICSWVKPFAAFKPNVGVAYAWEPVIVRGGRPRTREQPTVRDWVAANITLRRGMPGAKPREFIEWIMDILNVQPGDEMEDVFPGSGAVQAAINDRLRLQPEPIGLFA
jgi:hypothetical protein